MAATGVLPFVRGIDLSRNDFEDDFPEPVGDMSGLQWLALRRTSVHELPDLLANCSKLEHLLLMRNSLASLPRCITTLKRLRSLNLRHNRLQDGDVPEQLFAAAEELSVVDLSYNLLRRTPDGLPNARALTVLNLSGNEIDQIPPQLFLGLTGLMFLDLSRNRLETLPPQTRRLINLQHLHLSHNPLTHFQFRQLPALIALKTLSMRDTDRTASNLPSSLDMLTQLEDVDLGENELESAPQFLYTLPRLRKLNLSNNAIGDLGGAQIDWPLLAILNVSSNRLKSLPSTISQCVKLRRLYLDNNRLTFDGIPPAIGRLEL